MIRRAFLRRMAFAALACGFLDHVPTPTWDGAVTKRITFGNIAVLGHNGGPTNGVGTVVSIDSSRGTITVQWPEQLRQDDYEVRANA